MLLRGICQGFVLTGGASSRMGQDKALMEVEGRPLVLYVADIVQQAVNPVTLVGSRQKYQALGLPVVEDLLPGFGPLSGIHAALKATTSPLNLVVGCDMPFLNPPFLEMMIQVAMVADTQVTVAESPEYGFETMCAVYNRDCLPGVEESIKAGDLKLSRLYERLRVRLVSAAEWGSFNTQGVLFQNVNTPGDFQQARRLLESIAKAGAEA